VKKDEAAWAAALAIAIVAGMLAWSNVPPACQAPAAVQLAGHRFSLV
jgi:hypothetical protein